MNPKLLSDLKSKLKDKDNKQKQYEKERAVLRKRFEYIFFKELPPMFNNNTSYFGDECKILGWSDKSYVSLWIDTTKENITILKREEEDILDCIMYEHYGHKGRLSYHDNDELRLFLDNIDIVLKKLVK